jgi:hypothetical protein
MAVINYFNIETRIGSIDLSYLVPGLPGKRIFTLDTKKFYFWDDELESWIPETTQAVFNPETLTLGSAENSATYFQYLGTNGQDAVWYDKSQEVNVFRINSDDYRICFNESDNSNYRTIIGGTGGDYPLTIRQSGTQVGGYGYIQAGIQGQDSEIGFQFDNLGSGGRSYNMFSTNSASGVGAGNFIIADATAGIARVAITSTGNVGINTITPDETFTVNGNGKFSDNLIIGVNHTLTNFDTKNLIVGTSHTIIDSVGGACVMFGEAGIMQNTEAASIIGGYGCEIIDSTDCIAGGNNATIINSNGALCLGIASQVTDSAESVAIGGNATVSSVPLFNSLGSLAMMSGIAGAGISMAFMGVTNATGSVAMGYGVVANKEYTTSVDSFEIIGNKFDITAGTNKAVGTVTLSAGSVTVNNTTVTANSLIFINIKGSSVNGGIYRYSIVPGTSFTITSSNGSDANTVGYLIIN